ncbi:LMBR1 domain-containing protein 2 homolog isoform X2 [Varroa jacobsoni]|uniref:LMBR1 domain-containing protein 2 homolog isoform X2 n=1 Tax=Varroa jacobsoni TaxID=62625 RepID=UPI000BF9C6C0|nr:LMBR1 domain-containing protein 2 homolog isoform X2 [Varroa jacobsoni]
MEFGPLIVGLVSTFFLAAGLLWRYGQPGRHHMAVTASVFLAWYFSMLIIILMPLDVSSTAYKQCLTYHNLSAVPPHEAHGPHAAALTLQLRAYAGPANFSGNDSTAFDVRTSTTSSMHQTNDQANGSVITSNRSPSQVVVNSTSLGAGPTESNASPAGNVTNPPYALPVDPTHPAGPLHPVLPSSSILPHPINDFCPKPWSRVPDDAFPVLWRIVYWSSQLLTWIILPLMQSYSTAGDFTTSGKLRTALYENAIYYGTYLCIFVVLLVYLIINGIGLDGGKLKVLLITASNTWGLFLLVLLLGSGLVDVPRTMWNLSRKGYTLRYLYFKAAKLSMEKCETEERLDDAIEELRQVNNCITMGSPLRRYVDVIISRIPRAKWEDTRRNRTTASGASVSEKSLVRLHKQVIKAMQGVNRTQVQWDQLLADILYWEDISKNEANVERRFKSSLDYRPRGQLTKMFCTPTVEWYWRCLLRAVLLRALAVIFAGFTILIMFSEVTFFIRKPLISVVGIIHSSLETSFSYFGLEVFSATTLGYLCLCTYYTLFKIRIFNLYYLVPHQQTSEYSLIFSGMMLCRLTPPLCLNFLGMTHLDQHISREPDRVETAYTKIMGHMDVISIVSDGFNVYFPMLICVLGVATYLKWGSKIVHALGFEQFLADDDLTIDLVDEGRDLVKREKNRRQRQLENEIRRRQRLQTAPSQEFSPGTLGGGGVGGGGGAGSATGEPRSE